MSALNQTAKYDVDNGERGVKRSQPTSNPLSSFFPTNFSTNPPTNQTNLYLIPLLSVPSPFKLLTPPVHLILFIERLENVGRLRGSGLDPTTDVKKSGVFAFVERSIVQR
jgi:hypothetical protein